jgi:Tfp pilus assembly pilus retraction ATPase PilT
LPGNGIDLRHDLVAASEVLVVTPAVANLIATGKGSQIYSAMESGTSSGMQTLEQDLARLWVSGRISEPTAVSAARNVPILRDRAAMLRRRTGLHPGIGREDGT